MTRESNKLELALLRSDLERIRKTTDELGNLHRREGCFDAAGMSFDKKFARLLRELRCELVEFEQRFAELHRG